MVERAKRSKGQKKLLANHQRSWIWGRNLVGETLQAGRWPILELWLADDLSGDELLRAQTSASQHDIKTRVESRAALARLCHSAEHQGYVARMGPFPYSTAKDVLSQRSATACYVVLDSIQDPFNFGALLRSAEVFAVEAVFIGAARQVPVNSLVARSSAGAVSRIAIVREPDLAQLADKLSAAGVTVVAGTEKGEGALAAHEFRGPTALVLGNEGTGIGPELLAKCHTRVRIPQSGTIGSLNVAAAAAILFYEVRRQQAASR